MLVFIKLIIIRRKTSRIIFMKKSKLPDPICTRCGVSQNSWIGKCIMPYQDHKFPDPAQAKFEDTKRKNADKQYKRAKAMAKAGIQSELYTGKEDRLDRKLDQEQGVNYMEEAEWWLNKSNHFEGEWSKEKSRNKKLKKIIWSIVGVVIIISWLILR